MLWLWNPTPAGGFEGEKMRVWDHAPSARGSHSSLSPRKMGLESEELSSVCRSMAYRLCDLKPQFAHLWDGNIDHHPMKLLGL